MIRPTTRLRDRSWRMWAALAAALALVGGLGLAWSVRDPWPARVVIRPRDGGWAQGFTRDGREYRTSGERGVAYWDAATGREVKIGPLPVVWRPSWTDDGRRFAGVVVVDGTYGQAVAWGDAATDEVRGRFSVPGRNAIRPRLDPDGRTLRAVLLVTNGHVRELAAWDLATGAESRRAVGGPPHLRGTDREGPIGYSADGRTWAYIDPTRGVLLWDAEADRPLGPGLPTPAAHPGRADLAAFSPDGRSLALARDDGQIELWDVPAGRLLRVVAAHPAGYGPIEVGFSPDGTLLASAAHEPGAGLLFLIRDQYNRFSPAGWQVPDRREVAVLNVATGQIRARSAGSIHPQFSPDGRTLATHEADGSFSLRDIPARP